MRRVLFALVAAVSSTIALTQIASAADLSRRPVYKAPPPAAPLAPVYSWTGCYVGLNAGGVWGRMHDDWTPNGWSPEAQAGIPSASTTLDGSGFTGGGQVGCNWQMNSFVLGGEADIQYTGLDETRDEFTPGDGKTIPDSTIHQDFRSRWLATFRGRLGWLFTPTVLVYGTGGLAVANVETTDSFSFVSPASIDSGSASDSATRAGWTAGGGVEWMFAPQWSVKVEYLYVDLGHDGTTGVNLRDPTQTINFDHHLTEHIARIGVNYHF